MEKVPKKGDTGWRHVASCAGASERLRTAAGDVPSDTFRTKNPAPPGPGKKVNLSVGFKCVNARSNVSKLVELVS